MIHTYERLQLELKNLLKKRKSAINRLVENEKAYEQAKFIFIEERSDVEALEDQSLSNFIQNLFRNYEEKLAKEKEELVAAKIELDTASALYFDAQEELTKLDKGIEALKLELDKLREILKQTDEKFKRKMTANEQNLLTLKQEEKELDEAIQAGNDVLDSIEHVLEKLDSADSMATWDLFTDSFLIDMAKYNKINQAEKELTYLERMLDRYKKELKDVELQTALAYEELGQMSRAFDIFFDNIFSDWSTKDTIQRNIFMLEDMMNEVEDVQNLLYERERKLKEKIKISEEYL